MIIVFVVDNFLSKTDGTTVSAHRFREELIKQGHTVRVVAIGVEGQDMYGLKEHYVPIVTPVAKRNHMRFGKFDKKVVEQAFTGADVVHLVFPWQLERKCLRLAKKMGIPVTGAFHCQPENITYNAGLKRFGFVAYFLYWLFNQWLYKDVENIHCPSNFLANELKKHKYKARLQVISNGISDFFKPPENPLTERRDDKINVTMIGRLAPEKRQDVIINAVKHSKYRDRIQLYFSGHGPSRNKYINMSADLPNPPRFEVWSPDELLQLLRQTDIYIHASDVDLESLSCIEAFSCGKAPIISDSPKSATPQFALDKRNLFKHGDYLDLRDKLDYWIEHPEERERMGKEYVKLGEQYNIRYSALKMSQMFKDAALDFELNQGGMR